MEGKCCCLLLFDFHLEDAANVPRLLLELSLFWINPQPYGPSLSRVLTRQTQVSTLPLLPSARESREASASLFHGPPVIC